MSPTAKTPAVTNPWNALWAMLIGFFMILVDSTIVSVANPSIMEDLHTDYGAVLWVTSAYLLAYAVPLLVSGRLGDQFGPKRMYLIGLFVFTAASLWCGLSGSIEMLVTARVVQGIGAALLTPQTLSTITRIFPAEGRGVAMSVWGATAGVATLVGPLAGGVLVDGLGWQWIFIVNVPIGVVGLVLAYRLVPDLPTSSHRFDVPGIVLSGAAMFLVVFALQEGESRGWSAWIWLMLVAGAALMAAFVRWQAVNTGEPLIPLRIFSDRDFTLSNIGVAVIGFAVTAMIVPVMFYAQVVCGLSPTESALLIAPMAVISGALAPLVGRIVDRAHPTPVIGFGFATLAVALTWLSVEMTPTTPIWRLVLPFAVMGVAMAFIWSPLAATATRQLPPDLAGAGSGVYNTTRQIGSVLGSAGIAAFMTARIGAELPGRSSEAGAAAATDLPAFLHPAFSAALSQSMLLPAFIALFGVVAALFLVGTVRSVRAGARPGAPGPDDRSTEVLPAVTDETGFDAGDLDFESDDYWRAQRPLTSTGSYPDSHDRGYDPGDGLGYGDSGYDSGYDDDDDYVEVTLEPERPFVTAAPDSTVLLPRVASHPDHGQGWDGPGYQQAEAFDDFDGDEEYRDYDDYGDIAADESDTTPLPIRVEHPRPAPADTWHSAPVESWHSLLADESDAHDESIGHAHNGFHVEPEEHLQPLPPPPAREPQDFAAGYQELADELDSLSEQFSWFGDHRHGDTPPPAKGRNGSRHSAADELGWRLPGTPEDTGRRGRHYRDDPDDFGGHGRHARP